MNKLQETRERYKNAKIVNCATEEDFNINIKENIIEDMHYFNQSVWITVKHEGQRIDVLLYSCWRNKKWADIVETID